MLNKNRFNKIFIKEDVAKALMLVKDGQTSHAFSYLKSKSLKVSHMYIL